MIDAAANFVYGSVLTAPAPTTTGPTLVVTLLGGCALPTAPYNGFVWAAGIGPLKSGTEIVRITAASVVGAVATLTITRAQEGTTARGILVGDQFAVGPTAKFRDDIVATIAESVGDVVGPASSVDSRPALFDGITGKLLKQASAALGTAAFQNTGAFDAAGAAAAAQAASDPVGSAAAAVASSLQKAANLSDVASAATAFGNVKQAASDSATGVVELATVAEAGAGTDTSRAVTPAGLFPAEVAVASGGTTNIGAAASKLVQITGTTTITAFDTVAAGIYREGRFAGVLTFTHNATSLIIPGGANITTAVNDRFGAYSLGTGNWLVIWYAKADGTALVGGVTDGSVTLAKLANLAQDQFIGRTDASTGVPQTATITAAARTVLDDTTVSAMVDTLGGAAASGTGGIARATSPTLVTPTVTTSITGTGALTIAAGSGDMTLLPGSNGQIRITTPSTLAFTIGPSGSTYFCFNDTFGSYTQVAGTMMGWTNAGTDATQNQDTAFGRTSARRAQVNNGTQGQFGDLDLRNLYPTGGNGFKVETVATLPTTAATGRYDGANWIVTDALTPVKGSTVASGGSVRTGVHWDNSNWIVN